MRPRHKAAENEAVTDAVAAKHEASMRPRHKAAENGGSFRRGAMGAPSFNEAAA